MARDLIPIPIYNGLDTKTDSKQEEAGFLRRAENIVYETVKKLRKRNGYDRMSFNIAGGGQIDEPLVLTKFKEELVLLNAANLYTYSESLGKWMLKGAVYPIDTESFPVIRNASSQTSFNSIIVDNFQVSVWVDASTGARYSVQDLSTKAFLVSNAQISATATRARVARLQNTVYVIYTETTNIKFKSFSILVPQTLTSATTVETDVDASNNHLDAITCDQRIFVAYNSSNGGAELSLFAIDLDGGATSVTGITGANSSDALTISCDEASRILLGYSDGAEVGYTIYPYTLTAQLLAPTQIAAVADVVNMTIIETDSEEYLMYYEISGADTQDNFIRKVVLEVDGTVGADSVFVRSLGLASKAFYVNDELMVNVVHDSELQPTYFTLNSSAAVVTKFANQTAKGLLDEGSLPQVSEISSSRFLIPNGIKSRLTANDGTFYSTAGGAITILDFDTPNKFKNAFLAENLHICAGVLKMYDGATVSEHGFHFFPETLVEDETPIEITVATSVEGETGVTSEVQTIDFAEVPGSGTWTLTYGIETTAALDFDASTAEIKAAIEALTQITSTVTVTGDFAAGFEITYNNADGDVAEPTPNSSLLDPLTGGSMSDGIYSYVAVYRWTDNNGRDHQSAPTQVELQVELDAGGTTQTATITIPTLRLTEKTNVVIDLYRTEDAGINFYKVTDNLNPLENDTSVDTVNFTDTLSDTALISREPLYTTGGVIENIAAPACSLVTVFNDRLVVVGENKNRYFLSKEVQEGFPVEFTDIIYRDVDPIGGPITGIIQMADKLVAFEAEATFFSAGDGPNNLGQQDTLTKPERVAIDIGCIDSNGIVLTPKGLIVKSRKGLWLITSGFSVSYVGAPVEQFNAQVVMSSDIVGELNQIRFLLSEQRALVYNYDLDRWATFENHGGRSAVVIGDDYYYLREDGEIYKEMPEFADSSSPIKMRLETGWLYGTALQGYQRIYHMLLLGQYKSPHKLRIRVAYDFNEAWAQEKILDPADFIDASVYGSESPYGSGTPYGGSGVPYQARIDFKRQKCTAIKISIEDVQENTGEGLDISAITFAAKPKKGSNKLATAQKFGTS